MGEVQKITIEGHNYVLMREADYDDMLDSLHARAIMAGVEAGEETYPHELAVALADESQSRLRTWRKYRGLTMKALAEKAGLSQPYLSDIENGKADGSISAMKALAAALDVGIDDLV